MAKDERLYGKFTLDFADNPKILPLSDGAFRCLVEATLYSRKMLTDGFLAGRLASAKWSLEQLQELCANDPEKPSLIEVDGGYLIRDFAEHQDTKAEVEARRQRAKSAGSLGGKARAKQAAKQTASDPLSKTQAETETETHISLSTKERERPAKRGSRLSESWLPTAESVAVARAEAPDVDHKAEHATFVDYWIAQPGQKGVKTNWDATWRNWMRRKQADLVKRPLKPTKTERAMSVIEMGRRRDEAKERGVIEA